MFRLSKEENKTEALIIGCGFLVFGIIFIFAGAQSLRVIFGVVMMTLITTLMTAFLCFLFDVSWDSEMGVGISGVSFLLSAPFVQYGQKFSDKVCIPIVTGLSLASVAQIALNLAKVTDVPPYHYKTVTEAACFCLGILVALKIKDFLAMFITSFFGGFICTMAGSIIINEMPMKDLKYRNGKISMTQVQLFRMYMPYMISILLLTIIGFMYQREQAKDKERISAQQQHLSKMMNSKPKMSMAQMERNKAKMAAAARSNSSAQNSTGATKSFQGKEQLLNNESGSNNLLKPINASSNGMTMSNEDQFSGDNSRKIIEQRIKGMGNTANSTMTDMEKQSFLSKF